MHMLNKLYRRIKSKIDLSLNLLMLCGPEHIGHPLADAFAQPLQREVKCQSHSEEMHTPCQTEIDEN